MQQLNFNEIIHFLNTNNDLNRLPYSFVNSFVNKPIINNTNTLNNLTFEETKEKFKEYTEKICDIECDFSTLSGGLDSTLLTKLSNTSNTLTLNFPSSTDNYFSCIAKNEYKLENFNFNCNNIDFIFLLEEYCKIIDFPYGDYGTFFLFASLLKLKKETNFNSIITCYLGDALFMGIKKKMLGNLMYIFYKKKAFDLSLSTKISNTLKYTSPWENISKYFFQCNDNLLKAHHVENLINEYEENNNIKFKNINNYFQFYVTYHYEQTRHIFDNIEKYLNIKIIEPLDDKDYIDFCLSIPSEYKISLNASKILVRECFGDILPEEIIYRPTEGLGPSIESIYFTQYYDKIIPYYKSKIKYLKKQGLNINYSCDLNKNDQTHIKFISKLFYITWISQRI